MHIDADWFRAVSLFNRGDYYQTHEILEPVWLRATGWDRHFLAGIIQLASALHKDRHHGNPRAARLIYARALRHLAWLPGAYYAVDLRALERSCLAALSDPSARPTIPLLDKASLVPRQSHLRPPSPGEGG